MRKALVLLAAVATLAACGSTADEDRPGNPAVYDRIASTSDCAALQQEFDTAATHNDAAEPGTDKHRMTLGYMKAADERMQELDCY